MVLFLHFLHILLFLIIFLFFFFSFYLFIYFFLFYFFFVNNQSFDVVTFSLFVWDTQYLQILCICEYIFTNIN